MSKTPQGSNCQIQNTSESSKRKDWVTYHSGMKDYHSRTKHLFVQKFPADFEEFLKLCWKLRQRNRKKKHFSYVLKLYWQS